MTERGEIIIIGAGVIGLQTALSLLEAGFGVTVAAKHWPGDSSIEYTSPWAGAHWRTHAGADDLDGQRFDTETYNHWKHLLETGEKDTGLQLVPSFYFWDMAHPETANSGASLWWRTTVSDFQILPPSALPQNAHFGVSYTSFVLDPYAYLTYLLSKLGDLGVKTMTTELETLDSAFSLPGIDTDKVVGMVNCTGMGALELVPDDAVFPTRGQTILVKGSAKAARLRVGTDYIAYTIPRPEAGTTVLGGCKDDGDWNEKVDKDLSERIMKHCKELSPELLVDGKFVVLREQVGRRPSRKGGRRVELVWKEGSQKKFVVHHYGHSGAGYQNSYGSAKEVVRLVQKALA